MKALRIGIVAGCALALLAMALNASAQSPSEAVTKCQTRVGPQRAKIQVNGDNIPAGTYHAVVTISPSGNVIADSTPITLTPNADGELDFEFNSNLDPGDVNIKLLTRHNTS